MENFLNRWMPINASAHGPGLDHLNALVHWLMAILFVGWGLYFVYVLFRFRAGKNPKADYRGVKSHISSYAEAAIVIAEVILLIGFAIPAWANWVKPPVSDDTLTVRVIGEQFAWNVHYPGPDGKFGRTDIYAIDASNPLGLDRTDPLAVDDVTTINQLHLPVDRDVTVMLSTKDVIHSFALPVMRVKQDAIPGMVIPVYFRPIMTSGDDRWEIACAQLCGLGHYRMRGFLTVHTEEGYNAWMDEQLAEILPKPEPEPVLEEAIEGEMVEAEAEAAHS